MILKIKLFCMQMTQLCMLKLYHKNFVNSLNRDLYKIRWWCSTRGMELNPLKILYARGVWLAKNMAYPLKPSSSQATRSHPEKARSIEPNALNETTISLTQHRITPISTPFQSKRKNWGVRKKEDPHREQEKVNKGKNWR